MNSVRRLAAVSRPESTAPAAVEVAIGAVMTVAAAIVLAWIAGLPTTFVLHAGTAFVIIGAIVWSSRHLLRLGGWLGPANRVTLARAGLVALLAGFVPGSDMGAGIGWAFALAVAALLLDGVDGAVARRTGTASVFGARFDMELDAALGLVLAVLVCVYDRTGTWVLLLGIPRYLFVAAGQVWPLLRRPLPPSQRRRVICVVQTATLAGSLAPWVEPPLVAAACIVATILLYGSFAIDVRELWRAASVPMGHTQGGRT